MHWKPIRLHNIEENWVELWMNDTFTEADCDFNHYVYRIDGYEYWYISDKFRNAFAKEYTWQALQGFWPPSLRDKDWTS